jgi:hypothetical protein
MISITRVWPRASVSSSGITARVLTAGGPGSDGLLLSDPEQLQRITRKTMLNLTFGICGSEGSMVVKHVLRTMSSFLRA